jgi:H+/Cl- antiporter ClcA
MDSRSAGWLIIAAGVALVFVGLVVMTGALNWFGRLPGDIRIEGEHTRVYIPIVSMLILSLAVSLVLYVIRRFF